jgi:hypothetical protein
MTGECSALFDVHRDARYSRRRSAMANQRHLEILRQGVDGWNNWAKRRLEQADLRDADLRDQHLAGFDFRDADLKRATLAGADLREAVFSNAYLRRANLTGANLTAASMRAANCRHATLSEATLTDAYLRRADLSYVDLTNATLTGTDLEYARLVDVNLQGAKFKNCFIYGVSVWNIVGEPEEQSNLIITPSRVREDNEASEERLARRAQVITVDDLEVAQFVNLLLHNDKVRNAIDTITSKVVLILGRFTKERKVVLDALRNELRHHNLTPILFDFAIPSDRDVTETVTLLARMARFIVADLTDPASIPMELQAIAPDVAVPIQSLVQKGQQPFSMFGTLRKFHWVLPPYRYSNVDELLANLQAKVIAPAEAKRRELKT